MLSVRAVYAVSKACLHVLAILLPVHLHLLIAAHSQQAQINSNMQLAV